MYEMRSSFRSLSSREVISITTYILKSLANYNLNSDNCTLFLYIGYFKLFNIVSNLNSKTCI